MSRRRKRKGRRPAPRRPRRPRDPNEGLLATGVVILLITLILFAIVGGLLIGWDYLDRRRYDRVIARVISVETSCLFEQRSGDRIQVVSRSDEFACAEEAGRRAAGERGELIRVLTVAYRYTSPGNGMAYSGSLQRDATDFPSGVHPGGTMPVYSLKSDPGRSRGLYQWPVD